MPFREVLSLEGSNLVWTSYLDVERGGDPILLSLDHTAMLKSMLHFENHSSRSLWFRDTSFIYTQRPARYF